MRALSLFKLKTLTFLLLAATTSAFANCCVGGCTFGSCSQERNRLYLRADLLYWHACADGLGFALRTNEPLLTCDYDKFSEKVEFPSEEWKFGFKLGLGFDSPCDYDIDLTWTHFQPDISKTVNGNTAKGIYVIPFNGYTLTKPLNFSFTLSDESENPLVGTTAPFGRQVEGNWEINLDIFDLGIGKKLCLCNGLLLLRPHMDFRYLSFDQKLKLNTDGVLVSLLDPTLGGPLANFNYESRFRNDFWGIGPKMGFDLGLALDDHWGLYGSFAASLLFGDRRATARENVNLGFNIDRLDEVEIEEPSISQQSFHRTSNQRCTSFVTDLGVGFYWNTVFGHGDCCYFFFFKAGWEQHYFLGQGVASAARNGSLFREENDDFSTQGLTITAALGF